MIDESSLYKRMCFKATEIQNAWVPQAGDFWYCGCSNCLTSDKIWVLDRHDIMAINPNMTNEYLKLHYYRDTVSSVMTSRDCGFGPFWYSFKIEGQLGHMWLPRFDQLMEFAALKPELGSTFKERMADFMDFVHCLHSGQDQLGFDLTQSEQQLALLWVMDRVYNKWYRESGDALFVATDGAEEVVKSEGMDETLFELKKILKSPRRMLNGGWIELNAA